MGNRFAALIVVWAMAGWAATGWVAASAACEPNAVELRWPGGQAGFGQARFSVKVADTEALREQGLMRVDHMPASQGMLFVYPGPEHAFFWMKDTLIPLDMVFADETGRVTVVHANAVPQDQTPIDGGQGVSFVLEINGGLAARMGIVPGSEMRSDRMDPAKAHWTCAQ